jgi:hypothetical protein
MAYYTDECGCVRMWCLAAGSSLGSQPSLMSLHHKTCCMAIWAAAAAAPVKVYRRRHITHGHVIMCETESTNQRVQSYEVEVVSHQMFRVCCKASKLHCMQAIVTQPTCKCS